jgi:hypothetical protein
MSEAKPRAPKPAKPIATPPEDAARVRESLGEGLRRFYDSVLDEPIPAEWLKLVGDPPERGSG